MRNYQQLLEQALQRAGRLTPSVSSVSKVTERFCEKQAGTGGLNTPSVSSVSRVDKHFLENNDDDYREMFEERVAIMEYDGGLSLHTAQVQANIICLAWFRENHQKRRAT